MADMTIKARYEADVRGYVRAMGEAKTATERLAKESDRTAAAAGKSGDKVARAAEAARRAQDKSADAAGRLRVAQAQLDAARDSGKTERIVRAEEGVARALRDVDAATEEAARAQDAYQESMRETGAQADTLADKVERSSAAMQTIGAGMLVAGGLMVAGFGKGVATAASFEKAMSSVKAATQESEENLAKLADAAERAGADTAYSAEEAAGAIEELAKAGVSTEDILSGGLDGALSLAAAGAMDVSEAAETAASAMVQFKLKGSDIPHVADLLAAGAGKAQGSVKDLGEALNQSGLVAQQTGLDIEETTGTLAMFANAGLTGSDAGTSFKTMLQRLNPQSQAAATLMEELGLSAYDAQGNFIGMEAYAGQLETALGGMSEQQRAAALNTLFGSDAIRAASVLYENGSEGVRKWTEAVDDAGYAAKVARDKQDNLAGDLEKLGGAFETVFLKSGSGANQVLRDMTQSLEGFVDRIGTLPDSVLSFGGIALGVLGGVTLLAGGILTLLPKIKDTRDAFNDLAPSGGKARGALIGVSKAAGLATGAIIALQAVGAWLSEDHVQSAESMEQALIRTAEAGKDVSDVALDEVFKEWATIGGDSRVQVDNMADAVRQIADPSLGQRINENLNFMNGWMNLPDDEVTAMKDRVHELSNSMGTLATAGHTDKAAAGFRQLTEEFEKNGVSAQDVFNQYPGYRDALMGIANDAGYAASEQELLEWALSGVEPAALAAKRGAEGAGGAMGDMAGQADGAAGSVEDLASDLAQTMGINPDGLEGMAEAMTILADESAEAEDKLDGVLDALFRAGLAHMSVRDAQAAMYEASDALNKAIEENAATLDLSTEAGRANDDALQGVATAGFDAARAYAEAGESQGVIRDALVQTHARLVEGYVAMGQTTTAAEALASEMMGIPPGVDIVTAMDQQALVIAQATGQAIEAIPGYRGVTIAVDEGGETTGSIQSKINAVDGSEEFIYVSDNGTVDVTQQRIRDVYGVERTVWVDDNGTIYGTQEDINAVQGKKVPLTAEAYTGTAERDLNNAARPRTVSIFAKYVGVETLAERTRRTGGGRYVMKPGLKDGGIARLPGYSSGGVLPRTGRGTDRILGVTSSGWPIARLDDGEMVVRRKSTDMYSRTLHLINEDHPSVHHLRGYATGGRAGREWSGTVHVPAVPVAAPAAPSAQELAAVIAPAVAAGMARYRPVFKIGSYEVAGVMREAQDYMGGR